MTPDIVTAKAPLTFDPRAIEKRVGLILLATDHSTEADFSRLVASARVGLFATRIAYANPVTPENLRAMQPRLAEAAALILPEEDLDVVCFSCTSASVVIGDKAVAAAIRSAKPNVPVVTPADAAARGLRTLGANRISVLTPYTPETSAPMARYFTEAGFSIASFTCLGLEDDREMARIAEASLVEAAVAATAPDAEALFISCTALRSASVAAEIEERIGRPVVTSNQASAWACLAHCGILPDRPDAGRLFANALAVTV
ncbi:ectoine utilization protein EutA [Aurantimonas sp. VKM B-3413]|uniref:ectoine utilization protein EutA n=1 Tax=Aurantimonas sp. VKM B-3413 TaxID=2779401 RepID=UPI001E5A4DD1|nr:ectoine utilization protein EutA [Aurantimonas sp. VKM B-3413]MCB8836422.1 ectoine utilization protein EutA [Aurantimonas sp. VKM B-3413]